MGEKDEDVKNGGRRGGQTGDWWKVRGDTNWFLFLNLNMSFLLFETIKENT